MSWVELHLVLFCLFLSFLVLVFALFLSCFVLPFGGSVQLGKRLKWPDNYFTLIGEVSCQQFRLQNYNTFIFGTGTAYNAYGRVKLTRSSIDQTIFPTLGSEISFSVQFTPPYSLFNNRDYSEDPVEERFRWLEYHKWRFDAEWYTPIAGKLVLKAQAKDTATPEQAIRNANGLLTIPVLTDIYNLITQ